jgi:hypothetical protein
MPVGVYKHKPNQGFQKGNNLGCVNKGRKVTWICKGHKKGTPTWNKGLTKETDGRVRKNAESVSETWYLSFDRRRKSMEDAWKRKKEGGYLEREDVKQRLINWGISSIKKQRIRGFISRPQARMAKILGCKYNVKLIQEYPLILEGKLLILDVAYPEEKVAVEFNGKHWHTDEKDKKRKEILQRNGWSYYYWNEDNIHELRLAIVEANEFLYEKALENFREVFKND